MTSETQNLKLMLQSLSSDFLDLEDQLAPLFAQSLPETLVDIEPIQAAKLQTVIAYVVYDLIFIYLKTKGINPKSHPVISELDRVKQYFTKIQNAENPPKRATELDKAAASRFIKHAISEAQSQQVQSTQLQWKKTRAEEDQEEEFSSSEANEPPESTTIKQDAPLKMTSKMLARQQYEKELREQDANANTDDDDVLEVFGQNFPSKSVHDSLDVKDNGKGKAEPTSMMLPGAKCRRPVMDPFSASGVVSDEEPPSSSRNKSKFTESESRSSEARPQPSQSASQPGNKARKKKQKNKSVAPSRK